MTMKDKAHSKIEGLQTFPVPSKGFDMRTASKEELVRHGLPRRPDPRTHSTLATLWEQRARRYLEFEHLEPKLIPAETPLERTATAFALSPFVNAGFELVDAAAQITMLTGTWTVPNLSYTPNQGFPNKLRTFFGLGFLDLHVELTITSAQTVTIEVRIHTGAQVALPVRPGDTMSATLCLQTNAAGTAFYGLVNETTGQTMNFNMDTQFPPAVSINAGIGRGSNPTGAPSSLARFGVVYFDELIAYSTHGNRFITNGVPTSMVGTDGTTLARPLRLNDRAFKIYDAAA